jgi:hypothetical protein
MSAEFEEGDAAAEEAVPSSVIICLLETDPLAGVSLLANPPAVNLYNRVAHGSFDYRYSGTAIQL